MLHNALLVTDVSVCDYIYSSDAGTWHVDMLTGDFEGGFVCMARWLEGTYGRMSGT
jgi:hypothetical protein